MSKDRGEGRVAREITEELGFHVEGLAAELEAAGWTREDAWREALRRFGDVERTRDAVLSEHARETRRGIGMSMVVQDVRYAFRTLRRSPGFTVVALLTLGLGIGATTAIFSVVDGVLFRPLPYPEADRLVVIFETNRGRGIEADPPSPPNFLDWRAAGPSSIESMAAWRDGSLTLTGVERAEVVSAAGVTANFFDVLRVAPEGRGFLAGEDEAGGARVVVVSDGAWRRIWGGDPGLLGRTIELDGISHEVVGIAPPDFAVPRPGIQVWAPSDLEGEGRQSRYLGVIGRLARGASPERANTELDAIAARLAEAYPEANGGWRTRVVRARDRLVGEVRLALLLTLAAVSLVLLIACVNVANLLLGRSAAREGELAVRAALGAGTGRLRGQLITESVVLAVLGGALGVVLAHQCVELFLRIAPDVLPRASEVAVDARILAFTGSVSLLTGALFGVVPGVRYSRASLLSTLADAGSSRASGRGGEATRRILIVAEMALCLVLLVGAGLALRSLVSLQAVRPGYTTEGVVIAHVDPDDEGYAGNARKLAYFEALLERIEAIPGVRAAGVTSTLPLTPAGVDFDLPYIAEGQPLVPEQDADEVSYRIISPGYLEAMSIPLLRGRPFDATDGPEGRRVLLVNDAFARTHWPGEEAVGRTVKVFYVQDTDWEVIGVVGDTRHTGLSAPTVPQIFVPMAQAEYLFGFLTIAVRKDGRAADVEDRMREAALAIDPREPLYRMETIEALVSSAMAPDRAAALVFGLFATLALTLSVVGIYGVISYQVTQRTREIGVRLALGAAPGRVVASVVREAARLALAGIALGLAGSLAATRFARGHLFGVSTTDPLTFIAVSLLLFAVAVVAALIPAARAARVHPAEVLRSS